MASSTLAAVLLGTIAVLTVAYLVRSGKSKSQDDAKPLLKLPLIGDLHKSPINKPLLNWDAWATSHGDVATASLLGIIPVVVLNTADSLTELFSRRSAWYSNRPPAVTAEMITDSAPGACKFTLLHDYDDALKLQHRILTPSLGAVAAPKYQPVMELEATQMLVELIALSKESNGVVASTAVYPLLERVQASVILALHYGHRVADLSSDPVARRVIEIQAKVTHVAANPELPDMLPFLRNLPAPLSPWRRKADALFREQELLYGELLKMGKSAGGWNATKQALATARKLGQQEQVTDLDLAFTLATSIQGGMETSPRQLLWLFVAAVNHGSGPDGFMRRAHAILDDVVGRDRLPRFADRPRLAYIDAIASELLRWRPISPGAIPRRADKADALAGAQWAKGAVVFPNAWAIGRDKMAFSGSAGQAELATFAPERWLDDSKKGEGGEKLRTDLPLAVFGAGRRACQGRRVAIDGAYAQIVHLLWAFDIEPVAPGSTVDDMEMRVEGFMIIPPEFRFRLKPRGSWVTDVVAREWATAERDVSKVMGSAGDVESSK
jgi:cytochrome P450